VLFMLLCPFLCSVRPSSQGGGGGAWGCALGVPWVYPGCPLGVPHLAQSRGSPHLQADEQLGGAPVGRAAHSLHCGGAGGEGGSQRRAQGGGSPGTEARSQAGP